MRSYLVQALDIKRDTRACAMNIKNHAERFARSAAASTERKTRDFFTGGFCLVEAVWTGMYHSAPLFMAIKPQTKFYQVKFVLRSRRDQINANSRPASQPIATETNTASKP